MQESTILNKQFVDRCYAINTAYSNIHGFASTGDQFLHAVSEFTELADVLRNKVGKDGKHKYGEPGSPEYIQHLEDEAADIFLVAMATLGFIKFDHDRIERVVNRKLSILEQRVRDSKRALNTAFAEAERILT